MWLSVVVFLGAVLRLYRLGDIPNGLYQDETAIGYNAYSLLETGKDEYGRFMPMYFQSFGDWKLPVYVYLTVPSIAVFGLTGFAVRFPSAFFGILTIPFLFLLVREVFRGKNDSRYATSIALVSSALLALNPWHIHYSRATFEVSVALCFFVCGSYLIVKWFKDMMPGGFLAGTLLFVLSAYSYNLTRLLAPVLYIWIVWWGLSGTQAIKRLKSIEAVSAVVLATLCSLPMVWTLLNAGGASSASGTLIFSSAAVQAPLLEFRSYMVNMPGIAAKLLFNQPALTMYEYVKHVVSYLSVDFFFIHGSPHGNHGIQTTGQFYIIEIPFMIVGLVWLLMRKHTFFIVWWVVVIIIAALTREAPHATRSFFLVAPMVVASAIGLVRTVEWVQRARTVYSYSGLLCIAGFGIYGVVYYLSSYYYQFPVSYAAKWRAADKPLTDYISSRADAYDMVAIDPNAGYVYTSYLFYTAYPPDVFQKSVVHMPADSEGFTPVAAFGTVLYASRADLSPFAGKKILYVTSPQAVWEKDRELTRILLPKRPVVFNLGQQIISYPIEETAYVVVEVDE